MSLQGYFGALQVTRWTRLERCTSPRGYFWALQVMSGVQSAAGADCRRRSLQLRDYHLHRENQGSLQVLNVTSQDKTMVLELSPLASQHEEVGRGPEMSRREYVL
ncbi:hypothetical protein NDU88_009076 [Pleurodeles waltl]|uniref:Uncharacterized protein n=1 Tax=Pleurodeles waltl TaxID=8319 RepID=A0AAV7NZL8_PLEWA|nr:hypothetical protein NDU88_009076 [Pleurodeles waltl]